MTSAEFFARCAELTFQSEPAGTFTNLDEDLYTWATESTSDEPKPFVAVGADRSGGVMPFMQWFARREEAAELLATSAVTGSEVAAVLCDKTGPNWRFEIAEPDEDGNVEFRAADVDEAARHLGI